MDEIKFFIVNHKPQFVFFAVFMTACVPVLVYYRRRHANPRFRPSAGEMTMVTLFATVLSMGAAMGLGSLFNDRQDFKKLVDKPEMQDNGTVSITESRASDKTKRNEKKEDNSAIMGVMAGEK